MSIIRKKPPVKVIGINGDGSAKLNREPFSREEEQELTKQGFTGWTSLAYMYDASGDTPVKDKSQMPSRTIDFGKLLYLIFVWGLILLPIPLCLLGVLLYLHILYIVW